MTTNRIRCAVVALALAAAAMPALSQPSRQRTWNQRWTHSVERGETKVIAIQVWADPFGREGERRYGVAPDNEPVPVIPGESLRLTLVGSGLFDGKGEEVPVGATFDVVAGKGDVRILNSGSNWVDVSVDRDARGLAGQIGYRVRGGYDMRGALTTGRITLETGRRSDGIGADIGNGGPYGRFDRRDRAREITGVLVEGILHASFDPRRDADLVEEIYTRGYYGVQRVAEDLARTALRQRIAVDPNDSVRQLYRVLLHRDRDQVYSDPGFRDNVNLMRRQGYREVVRVIVRSEEFQRVNRVDGFERSSYRYRYNR